MSTHTLTLTNAEREALDELVRDAIDGEQWRHWLPEYQADVRAIWISIATKLYPDARPATAEAIERLMRSLAEDKSPA